MKEIIDGIILGGFFIQRVGDRRTALETIQRVHGNRFIFIENCAEPRLQVAGTCG